MRGCSTPCSRRRPIRDAVVPTCRGARQPLCALYRRAPCLAVASELLARGSAGPKRLLDAVRTAFVD